MKRILILSTGGTIASMPTEDGLVPALTGQQMTEMIPELKQIGELECRQVCNLDSTNMQPEQWMELAGMIRKEYGRYDGVVILHGTDTMAYTASALSFLLQDISLPIMLTGSQIAMGEEKSDAKSNIMQAVQAAVDGKPGVYIVFAGKIIKGVRAKKMCTRNFVAFSSINEEPAGEVTQGRVIWNPATTVNPEELGNHKVTENPETPGNHKVTENPETPGNHKVTGNSETVENPETVGNSENSLREQKTIAGFNTNIAILKLYPGMDEKMLSLIIDGNCDGIIIEAFGCGGIPNDGRNLLPQIERATKKGIPVVITTQCIYDGVNLDVYEVGVLAKKLGVLSGRDMTIEALTAKLMWALGQTSEPGEISDMMDRCYVGEFSR